MRTKLSQLLRAIISDEAVTLQVRLYRLFAATTCVLCLLVVLPMNLQQNLPGWINVADTILGLIGGGCFWASLRGRHFLGGFYGAVLVLLNWVWFANAGSHGSIPYYFFPLILYPMTIFHGWRRPVCAALVVLNVCGLLVLEHFMPSLLVPFQSPTDRMIDLVSGAFASSLALIVIVRLLLAAYDREQKRLSLYAEKLAASEQSYRQIFNATSDALSIREVDGTLIDVNERFCTLYGYDRAEAFRISIGDISLGQSPYSQVEALEKLRRALAEGPQTFVWRSKRRNGELFWSEIALRAGEVEGKKRLVTAIRDITARVEASDNLRIQEERLRLSLEASKQGWFDIDVQSGEGRASGEYAKIIGLDPVDFQVSAREWIEGIHPDERERATNAFHECIATGQTRTLEYRRRTQTGEWKWIRSVGKIVEVDAAGKARRMLGTHTDITERKELEARLLHTQRLESVATLAGGVAHDLNNILTPMLMAAEVFHEKLTDESDRELMSSIQVGARRGAAIIRQLLVFSRSVAQVRSVVDVSQMIAAMVDAIRASFPKNVVVVDRVSSDLWQVTADAAQLQQVVQSLCTNAREAMPAGGTLTLTAENARLSPRASTQNPWGKGGPCVMISVADTGCGIAPEVVGRVFDPFFTTKEMGKGAGLGLSSVHGIVNGHGGTVTVESEPGKGSIFRIFIPACLNVPPSKPQA